MTNKNKLNFRGSLNYHFLPTQDNAPVEWVISDGLTDYQHALNIMEERATAIANGLANEQIWLVEHPPLYTAGTSAEIKDLLTPDRFPVFNAGRGGEFTYHGPGQRVVYVMLNLKKRRQDIRAFVSALEEWSIQTLGSFNVKGERREDRVGVWVSRPEQPLSPLGETVEDKIVAIGIRLRKWVSFHGIAINVEPDLSHYAGIVPCGISHHGVTSLVDLGLPVTMHDLDVALKKSFQPIFGTVQT